jgi:hypothetical protein
MRLIGMYLMWVGVLFAVRVVIAVFAQFGVSGAPWTINVAFAKLGFVAAAAGLGVGASLVRVALLRAQRRSAQRDHSLVIY